VADSAGDERTVANHTITGLRSHTFTVERATITGLAVTPGPAGFAAKTSPLPLMRGDLIIVEQEQRITHLLDRVAELEQAQPRTQPAIY